MVNPTLRRLAPVLGLSVIGGVALWSPVAAFALLAVAAIALIGRRAITPVASGLDRFDEPRVRRALAIGRQEAQAYSLQGTGLDPVVVPTAFGPMSAEISYRANLPFVVTRQPLGVDVELAFVIRRLGSLAGLDPVVDNTRVPLASHEIRLRRMDLGPHMRSFEAASSRPRLFQEFMEAGLADTLAQLADHQALRVEELAFSGSALTLLVHPAVDPSSGTWLRDVAELSHQLTLVLSRFLANAVIPTAQEL